MKPQNQNNIEYRNNRLQFIFKSDKEKIIEKLEYYGIKKLPFLLVRSGKEKIRAYSGSLSKEELIDLQEKIGVELIGMYLLHHYEGDENLRLSFDAISALKDQITKNILDINDSQAEEFLKGKDIILKEEDKEKFKNETRGFKIIRHRSEFIGTGKLTSDIISNYMPKERRLR